jgi:hypothetical protein
MIVVMLNTYLVLLALFVWLGFVPFNLFWKISPVIVLLVLLVGLFIPMGWGAPSGSAIVLRHSVQVIPDVAGEVIDVPAQPNTPVLSGRSAAAPADEGSQGQASLDGRNIAPRPDGFLRFVTARCRTFPKKLLARPPRLLKSGGFCTATPRGQQALRGRMKEGRGWKEQSLRFCSHGQSGAWRQRRRREGGLRATSTNSCALA